MDTLERLAQWKRIAADAVRAAGADAATLDGQVWEDEDNLFGYFQLFRPDGKGLEDVFAGVVRGDEIVKRLLRVYRCTREGYQQDAYFVVRRPGLAPSERLVDLTRQHLDKVGQMARDLGDSRLPDELAGIREINIKREPIAPKTQCDHNAPEASVYDVTCDWFLGLAAIESDARLMGEAFYSIACDYKIAHYLMWPLYRESTAIDDPFAPYFELWTHRALPFFGEPGIVTVYVG